MAAPNPPERSSTPTESPFKLLCPPSRAATVSSCLGPNVRLLDDHGPSSYDRVLLISHNPYSSDGSDQLSSLLRVSEAMVESTPSGEVFCRMLLPDDRAGDGELQRIREESGASLTLDKLNLPPGASPGEEVLQVLLPFPVGFFFRSSALPPRGMAVSATFSSEWSAILSM